MPSTGSATPTTITIKVENHREITINNCHEYTLYVNGQEYKELPLDANVREPDPKKSKPYKDMCDTLRDEPENFFENNLGISIIASDVTVQRNNKFSIKFEHGTGILNGGHTQRAILDSKNNANIAKAIIRLTVRVKNYTTKRIAEIAAAQNSCTAVKEYSLAEKKGLFAELKSKLNDDFEKHIVWYEGRTVAANKGLEPVDLIAIINVFNIKLYSSNYNQVNSQPTSSASAKASVFKKWQGIVVENPQNFNIIYPLTNDILTLYELIQSKFHISTGMTALQIIKNTPTKDLIFKDEKPPYGIPKQMLFPLLAAYRANVYYDPANKKIGWYEDIEELFNKHNKELCTKLKTSFKANGNDVNKIGKDPTIWENLYRTLKDHINTGNVWKTYDI